MSTVAPTPPRPPRPPLTPAMLDSEHYIDEHIRRTRRALKLVDLSAGVITLLAALLVFLLGAAVIDHWVVPGGLGPLGRGAIFGALLLLVAWIAWRQFVPLLRPINPVYAAHTIERTTPSLKNSLLNLLLFRTRRRNMSAKVYYALEQQAAQRLSTAPADAAIDHTALLRLGYALMLVVALCAAYAALSPKNLAVSAARVLAPWSDLAAPSRVQILAIEPGDTSVARGERLTVSAEIHGAREGEPVRLRYSTDDQQRTDESIPMTRPADGVRFEAQLPRSTGAAATSGVEQDLAYWIEAGDAHTRRFKVSVYSRPTMVVDRVRYEFPAYTGMPSAEVASSGDIEGLEGTLVTIQGIANQPIKTAHVDFDADGTNDLRMAVDPAAGDRATATFTLKLRPDRRTPAHPNYVLRLVTTAGRANVDPAKYRIEVTPDYAPEVRITAPEEAELEVRVDEIVPIGVEARDPDFAVQQVRLVGKSGDRELMLGELLSKNHEGRFSGMKPVVPADSLLKPGDVLEYWAEARDNRRPEANIALSEHRRLRIIGGADQGAQKKPDQQQPGQPQQGGGQNGENNPQSGQQGGQQAGSQGEPGDQSAGEGEAASAAGAGGQGEQQGEQNEQQNGEGQPSPGGGGESNQDPSSGGQNKAGDGNAGANQNPAGANADQQQPQPGDAENNDQQSAGGAQGGDPAGAKQSKVSPEGEDDGTAFDRMREHFANEDANNQSGDKTATGGRAANQEAPQPPNGQRQDPAQQPDAANANQQPGGADADANQSPDKAGDGSAGPKPDSQNNNAPNGKPQSNQQPQPNPTAGKQSQDGEPASAGGQQGDKIPQPKSTQQSPNQSGQQAGDGQAPDGEKPGEQANQKQDNANSGNPAANERRTPGQQQGDKSAGQSNKDNQQQPSPQSGMNRNQGDAGAGKPPDEQQGAPHMDDEQDPHKQARDKTPGDNEKTPGDQEAASGSPDKKESDSQGGQGGDKTGGGQQGKGQHADAPGKGEPGQHESADQGAGKSNQQGEGEAGAQAGDQQTADGKTGQSSETKPGAGSQQGAAANDKAATAGRDGEPASAGGARDDSVPQPDQQPGEESGDSKSKGQPGAQPAGGKPSPQAGESQEKPADPASDQNQQPQNQSPDQGAQPGGGAGQQPQGGGTSHGESTAQSPPDGPDKEDQANLDFARQQTDLVIERLDDQLAKKKVDRDLLDNLGWNEDQLRRFVFRWQGLKSRAANDDTTRQELDEALRSLGLRQDGPQKFRAAAAKDKIRDLNEGYRSRAPLEYADRVRAYVKGAAAEDADK